MLVLGLDFETTGLDTAQDRVIEIGAVLWDTETATPLEIKSVLVDPGTELSAEIIALTGIAPQVLRNYGKPSNAALSELHDFVTLHRPEYVVAHNGENYDRPLLRAELARHNLPMTMAEMPWIDTRTDIPFDYEPDSLKLRHLALDHGFMNPFEHRAVFDVLTMLRVLSNYPFEKVVEYSKIPFVTVRAMVSFDDRQLAKDQRFSWEKIGDKTFPKCWVKRVKENQLEDLKRQSKFEIVRLD